MAKRNAGLPNCKRIEFRVGINLGDVVIEWKLLNTLEGLLNDPDFNLGNQGYSVRRARGKGASGFIAKKNTRGRQLGGINSRPIAPKRL